jgi:hypothetical protein
MEQPIHLQDILLIRSKARCRFKQDIINKELLLLQPKFGEQMDSLGNIDILLIIFLEMNLFCKDFTEDVFLLCGDQQSTEAL